MITLQNVVKTYQSKHGVPCYALRGISYSFDKKKSYAITGASGSGKSTLLKLIAGISLPSSGNVFLNDKDITTMNDSKISRLRNREIGFVVQDFALFKTENVIENCIFPALIAGTSYKKAKARAKEFLEKLGLTEKINQDIRELSGGEKQRVAIVRAMINNPQVLLADEPTGALDSKTAILVIKELLSLCREETTLIMATHNTEHAQMCDIRLHLQDGLFITK